MATMLSGESPSTSSQALGSRPRSYASQNENAVGLVSHAQQTYTYNESQSQKPVPMPLPIQTHPEKRKWYQRRKLLAIIALVTVVVLFLVIFLPVFFVLRGRSSERSGSGASAGGGTVGSGGSGTPNPSSPSGATSGGDGSIVRLANGTEFTYENKFGGYWVQDPADPFNNNARPNSWTPPLNTTWRFGVDRIHGVNLGGLFVIEPFISPALFQRYPGTTDEYSLSQAMAADTANGGLKQLEDHYENFITEMDIAEIAGAGINWLRIPIGFWAIETYPEEPYLARTSWKYFLRVLDWARKYGLRVKLDLHAVPGSQNGYNHSGRLAGPNFLAGNMGLANAQRTLYYIRVLAQFVSQPEYTDLIPIFGIMNEPLVGHLGVDTITSFYLKAEEVVRGVTGKGEGKGPFIAIGDGFMPLTTWDNFLPGSDRIIMDQHPYFAFGGDNLNPMDVPGPTGLPGGDWPRMACDAWGPSTNNTRTNFGMTVAGEFSAAPNDCGLFMRGVGIESTHPQCAQYVNWEAYSDAMKAGIQTFIMASFDALHDWFFWTWKIGPSAVSGKVETPLWSYQLGLHNGWIPKDPRSAAGICGSLAGAQQPFVGPFQPWQLGQTTSTIDPASTARYPWPPAAITDAVVPVSILPTYTNTLSVITMPPPTYTSAPASVTSALDGWFNDQDSRGWRKAHPIKCCNPQTASRTLTRSLSAIVCASIDFM